MIERTSDKTVLFLIMITIDYKTLAFDNLKLHQFDMICLVSLVVFE